MNFTIKGYNFGDFEYGVDSGFTTDINSDMTVAEITSKVSALFDQKVKDLHHKIPYIYKSLPPSKATIYFPDLCNPDSIIPLSEASKTHFFNHLTYQHRDKLSPITIYCFINPKT